MAKRKLHDEQFKAAALVMLQAANYPDDSYALTRVADSIGVNHRTLRRWYNGEQSAPVAADVTQIKKQLDERLESIAHKLLSHVESDGVIDEMTGQAAITSAAIAIDKMRLLRSLPTEIVAILPDFLSLLAHRGIDATEFFAKARQRIEELEQ